MSLKMIALFCDIDDFCKKFKFQYCNKLINSHAKKSKINSKSKLFTSEIMTIIIYFHHSNYRNFKHYYLELIQKYYSTWFTKMVSYNRFIELMRQALVPMTIFITSQCMGKNTGLSFIDSTPLCVCDNHRIKNHRVFAGIATRTKSSTGWKFGFKLHLVINHIGEILSFKLTAANVNDRTPVPDLVAHLAGQLYGDKGYLSKKLSLYLKDKGLNLITNVRKNMQKQALKAFDKIMLRKRSIIESVNDQLKNISQIEHSRHRSVFNFAVNLIAGLIAYTRQPKKPHIEVFQLTKGMPMVV